MNSVREKLEKSPRSWFHNRGWKVGYATAKEAMDDDVVGLSAEVAFYGMFSLFPFVILLQSLEPYLPKGTRVIPWILDMIQQMTSGDDGRLFTIIKEEILQPAQSRRNGLLSVGIILTLWGASRGFGVVVKGINRAYGMEDQRNYLERRLMGLAMTLALLVFLIGGVLFGIFGAQLLEPITSALGLGFIPTFAIRILRWPVAFVLMGIGLGLLYHFAPVHRGKWRWTTPGSLFAVIAMALLSWMLGWFISQNMFQITWLTYSSFSFMLVILLWLYLMGFSVLVGGEINAVLDRRLDEGGLSGSQRGPGGVKLGPGSGHPPTDDDGKPIVV